MIGLTSLATIWSFLKNPIVLAVLALAAIMAFGGIERHRGRVAGLMACRAECNAKQDEARQRLRAAAERANRRALEAQIRADQEIRAAKEALDEILKGVKHDPACRLDDAALERLRKIR